MPASALTVSRYSPRQRHCIWQALAGSTARNSRVRIVDRPQLAKALQALGNGDTLVVCKLDRLARSTRDLLNTLDAIGKAGSTFKSLADQWADTTTPHGRLMLTVLGGLAEFERHLILSRTAEGRTRAQANGVRFVPTADILRRNSDALFDHFVRLPHYLRSGQIAKTP